MTKKQMVVKDNKFMGASYSLGISEQRLIFLAIIEAREQDTLIKAGGLLRVYAQNYAKQFNVEKHTAYEAMKRGVNGLYEAEFKYSYVDNATSKIFKAKSRFVQKIAYADELGCVELVFAEDVLPLITRLEERYTEYELKQVSALQSEYAIRLYELIIQWRSVGKTNKMSLEELRNKLGVLEGSYQEMSDFKKRVLTLALEQINKYTDITADYEQHKQGRVITAFTFNFKTKNKKKTISSLDEKREENNSDLFIIDGFSAQQLGRIARCPQFIADYNHLVSPASPANHSASAWEFEMINRLKQDATLFDKRPLRDYL